MLSLAGNIFECILWGIVISLALCALSAFIAHGISSKRCNLLLLAFLFIPLCYQATLATGAVYAKGYVDDLHGYVCSMTDKADQFTSVEEMAGSIKNQFPQIPESMFDSLPSGATTVESFRQTADIIADSYRVSLRSYMWHRIAWALGIMAVGIFVLVRFPASGGGNGRSRRRYSHAPARDRYNLDL